MLAALLERPRLRVSAISASVPTARRRCADTLAGGERRARSGRDLGRRVDRRGGSRQGRGRARWARCISGGSRSSPGGRWRSARSAACRSSGCPATRSRSTVTFAILARPLDPAARRRRGRAGRGSSRCAPASPIAKSRDDANMSARGWSATATEADRQQISRATAPASCRRSCIRTGSWSSTRTTGDLAPGATVDFLPFSRGDAGEAPLFRLAARADRHAPRRNWRCRSEIATSPACSIGCRRAGRAMPRRCATFGRARRGQPGICRAGPPGARGRRGRDLPAGDRRLNR